MIIIARRLGGTPVIAAAGYRTQTRGAKELEHDLVHLIDIEGEEEATIGFAPVLALAIGDQCRRRRCGQRSTREGRGYRLPLWKNRNRNVIVEKADMTLALKLLSGLVLNIVSGVPCTEVLNVPVARQLRNGCIASGWGR